jgi:hypothetical protein
MFFNLLHRIGADLAVDGCIPGRHLFTSLRISESRADIFFLGELGMATTAACF